MLKPEVEDALNAQIKYEQAAAHEYLGMAAYFEKQGLKGFARFMDRMKAPVTAQAGKAPTTEAILKRQDDCFAECIGMDPKAFDTAWVSYVLKTYPRR